MPFGPEQGPPLLPTTTGRQISCPNLCLDVAWTPEGQKKDQRISLTAVTQHGQILVSVTDRQGKPQIKTVLADEVAQAMRNLVGASEDRPGKPDGR